MAKLVLSDVANLLGNPTSAANTINNNSDNIVIAMEKTLSRDGTTPNQMLADFDMNHNDIINAQSIQTDTLIIDGSDLTALADETILAAQQAIAAAAAAQAALSMVANNWTISGPYTGTGSQADYLLTIDPKSPINMFVIVGGIGQLYTDGAYSLIYTATLPYIRITVPLGVLFEVRIGNSISVGTPADGTITGPKLASNSVDSSKIVDGSIVTADFANDAVTYAKMQNVSTNARVLGRVTAGSGDTEELTGIQLRDSILPIGTVVDSVSVSTASQAVMTAVIPFDTSIPQITEGTQKLSVSITPKSTTNQLRIRLSGTASVSIVGGAAFAVFAGAAANAILAGLNVVATAGYLVTLAGEIIITPGSTSPITISVRYGPTSAGNMWLNDTGGGIFGGSAQTTLTVEEIKA